MPTVISSTAPIEPIRFFIVADVTLLARALGLFVASFFSVTGLALAQSNTMIRLSPMVAKSVYLGEVGATRQISVVFSLPLTDSQGAAQFIQHVSDPHDPLYRHYLAPKEFTARFGASEKDYAALKEWVRANNLIISQESIARTSLTVRGSVAQFEELFKTQLNNYRLPDGQTFYSAGVEPTIPNAIASLMVGVIGLTNSVQYAPVAKVYKLLGEDPVTPDPDTAGGTGPGGAYSAADLRKAYEVPALGHLTGQTIALFEQGGFYLYDIKRYLDWNGLPEPPITFVSVNGYDGKVNPSTLSEALLDIDIVIGVNPRVKEVLVYEDGTDPFDVALVDALEQVFTDDKAETLSISYGDDEVQDGDAVLITVNTKLMQLAAAGISVFASAGDEGAYGRTGADTYPAKLNVSDPGAQPYITCVGGTTLFTHPGEEWTDEQVWNDLAVGGNEDKGGATGGGVSSYWELPSWQAASYVTPNGGSSSFRNVPDVAAVGNPSTGVAIYDRTNGGWNQIGGTSLSCPVWASYVSVLNAALEYLIDEPIGFLNPTLYSLGSGNPTTYLHDVTEGSNGNANIYGTAGYTAGLSYDNCSGCGSIQGGTFAYALLTSESGGTPPGPLNQLTAKQGTTKAKLSWAASAGATGYVILVSGGGNSRAIAYVTKETKFEISDLEVKTKYSVQVAAVNQGGSTQSSITFKTN
jgi:subtilase family serine protease